jgi:hypothetical protein
MFLSIERRWIQKSQRLTFQELVTEENFQILSMYHRFLRPCAQAVKFFEQDHISLFHVYPALTAFQHHFNEQAARAKSKSPDLFEDWNSFACSLRFRRCKLLDRNLVKAAFCLTSFGCTSLAARNELIPDSHQLQLAYETPRKLSIIEPLDATLSVTAPDGEMVDEARECAYLGSTITDGSLEKMPRIDVPK